MPPALGWMLPKLGLLWSFSGMAKRQSRRRTDQPSSPGVCLCGLEQGGTPVVHLLQQCHQPVEQEVWLRTDSQERLQLCTCSVSLLIIAPCEAHQPLGKLPVPRDRQDGQWLAATAGCPAGKPRVPPGAVAQ